MSSSNVVAMRTKDRPKSAPKAVRSQMDTLVLTQQLVRGWKIPPFQRPLRINGKVMAIAEELKCQGGVVPGILTIGVLEREKYLVDGQHRTEAFKISEIGEGYADVRICQFETMADMAEEFVNLNSRLVTMRPDDILRGLEPSCEPLAYIRKHCEFVGYDNIRRGGASAPILSMSATLRCWFRSASEVPAAGHSESASAIAKRIVDDDARGIVQFLNVAHGAWGRDAEYQRMWGALNMTICMWLWRNMVVKQYSARTPHLTVAHFGKCLMALTADPAHGEWLLGRNLGDRDRGPCYSRIRAIFVRRLEADFGKKVAFPQPAWLGRT